MCKTSATFDLRSSDWRRFFLHGCFADISGFDVDMLGAMLFGECAKYLQICINRILCGDLLALLSSIGFMWHNDYIRHTSLFVTSYVVLIRTSCTFISYLNSYFASDCTALCSRDCTTLTVTINNLGKSIAFAVHD